MAEHLPGEALLGALTPPLAAAGLDLEDVEVSTAGRRRTVRVLVDRDGGVTLDDIAGATSVVSRALDDSLLLEDSPYTLEVTSPGTDRPLTQPRHWRRNIDRLVKVQPHEGGDFIGRVLDAGEDSATLDVKGHRRSVGYAAVAKARVELEFNRRAPSRTTQQTTTEQE